MSLLTEPATPVLLAWSGGKDATLALERLRADARWRVAGLLTSVGSGDGRIAMHGVRGSLLRRQAAALELPLFEAPLSPQADNAAYGASFAAALAQARAAQPPLAHVAFGDIFLADLRAWREALLAPLGWQGVYPLWGEDTAALARQVIAHGHRAVLCCVDTQQLDAAFCGRDYDAALLADLPGTCDPCGENGEFHTCVVASPLFRAPIAVARGARGLRDGRFETIDLLDDDGTMS